MDEASARAILTWHYDPPYDMYSFSDEYAEETVQAFLDPQYAYYTLRIVDLADGRNSGGYFTQPVYRAGS